MSEPLTLSTGPLLYVIATEEEKVEKYGGKIKGFVWNMYAHILIKAIGVSLGVIAEKKRKVVLEYK